MSESQQVIERLYAAIAAGDVVVLLEILSPEIVWNEAEGFPYADGNPYKGIDAVVMGVLTRLTTEWEGFGVDVGEIIGGPEVVTMLGRYRGKCVANGKPLDAQCAHTWWLEGGKVVRFQQMVDTRSVAETLA